MKILLTNPGNRHVFRSLGFVFPPSGILYIAAYAEKMGSDIAIKDFGISDESPKDFSFKNYDIVGITSDSRLFPGAMEIAQEAKRQGCTVIMGGPHPQFVDKDLLGKGFIDFVVHGEGEITFHELSTTLQRQGDLSKVHGISYKDNGNILKTPQRELISDLDSLPFPARHLVDMETYRKSGTKYGSKRPVAVISSSRGCTHDCFFCAIPSISGRVWRCRSTDSIMEEIDHLYNTYNYRAIAFCDDNFTISTKRVKEICNRIIERKYDLWWWCMSSPNTLIQNEEMVGLMAKAGAKTVFIGVESASEKTLREYNKKMKGNTAEKAAALLKRHNIEIYASYILGGLNDSVKSILETIKLAKRLDSNVAQFTILTPYPGTALYDKVKEKIIEKAWGRYDGFHLVFRHKNVSYHKMQLLLLWAYTSYYLRSRKAIKGFIRTFTKNSLFIKKVFGRLA